MYRTQRRIADRACRRDRGSGPCRAGRHQFFRRGCQLGAQHRHAGRLERICRPVLSFQQQPVGRRGRRAWARISRSITISLPAHSCPISKTLPPCGRSAGERTVAKLNPQKLDSMRVPIILDPRVAGGLLGSLAGAISGATISRGISFLKDALGEQIFPAGITVMDDPYMRRGHRSKPFDGEGIAPMAAPDHQRRVFDHMAAGSAFRAAAGSGIDRPCGAGHGRPAGAQPDQSCI